jgi:hypothetical protein
VRTEVTGSAEDVGAMVDVNAAADVSVLADDAPAEEVGSVLVDVTTTVDTDSDEDETVVATLALDVAAEVESEDVPPVLDVAAWRFSMAMAMSTSLAETEDAVKTARRSAMARERMSSVLSLACQVDENGGRRLSIGKAAQVACKRA